MVLYKIIFNMSYFLLSLVHSLFCPFIMRNYFTVYEINLCVWFQMKRLAVALCQSCVTARSATRESLPVSGLTTSISVGTGARGDSNENWAIPTIWYTEQKFFAGV